ncbi:Ubiquitin-conjugating enzyme E2 O-like protein, partial [Dinothrombium tinctorium]
MAQKHGQNQRSTFVCDYFDEDIVYRITKRGKTEFGVIVESCENASSDEEDEEWDKRFLDKSWKRLKPGHTKIAWYPKGNTEVLPEKKVKLYDRSLLPGDVVRRMNQASNNQRGFCKDTAVTLTLKINGTNKIIEKVDCNDFIPLAPISTDVVCLYKSWIGYITDVKYNITVKFEDGSLAVVMTDDLFDFEDMWSDRDYSSEFASDLYYSGQQLYGPKKDLKKAHWLYMTSNMKMYLDSTSKQHNRIKLTVVDVNVVSVTVKWLCCLATDSSVNDHNTSANDSSPSSTSDKSESNETKSKDKSIAADMETPSIILTGEEIFEIKSLNYFQKCSLQVGDEGYYMIKDSDRIMQYQEWVERVTENLINEDLNYESYSPLNKEMTEDASNDSDSFFVDCDDDLMDVAEAPSTNENSISSSPSTRLKIRRKNTFPVKKVRDKKLKPAKRKDLCTITVDISPNSRVPVEVIAEKTLVTVVWQNGDTESNISSSLLYPIHHLDNHDFFPGDFVVENKERSSIHEYGVVQDVNHIARTAKIKWFRMYDAHTEVFAPQLIKIEDASVYDIKDHPDFHYRPGCCVIRIASNEIITGNASNRAGQVVDLSITGQLLCAWADGTKSYVYPQELYIVGEYDSDDLWADSDSESDSDTNKNFSFLDAESDVRRAIDCIQSGNIPILSPTEERKPSTTRKSKGSASAGDIFETLRKNITQLEEWFRQNQMLSNRNSLCPMQKIFKVCRDLKAIDDLLGTNLMKLKDLHSLIDTTKPPPGSPGTIQVVSNKITKLLSCIRDELTSGTEDKDKTEFSPTNVSSSHSTHETTASSNTDICLDLLRKLKSKLSQFCTDEDLLKNVLKPNSNSVEASNEITMEEEKCDEVLDEKGNDEVGVFKVMDSVPDCHKFKLSIFQPTNCSLFMKQVRKETMLLQNSLPSNIFVKTFEDRMDLFSVMIKGPKSTPYEDGIFLFDIQLPANYPNVPPVAHYLSFCSDRLNPNLYENGKVCVSLLGTWSGRGTEVWTSTSNLLQLIVSIQGLILVSEPYYNEAGYLKQRGTVVGQENSRLYNEMVVVKLVQSMSKLLLSPGEIFCEEIREHFKQNAKYFVSRLEKWLILSNNWNVHREEFERMVSNLYPENNLPDFPLLPGSQGFCLSLERALSNFKDVLKSLNIN